MILYIVMFTHNFHSLYVLQCNQLNLPSTGFVGVDGGGVAFDDELVLTTTMEVVDPELLLLVVVLLFELILLLVLMLLVVGLTTIGLTGWLDWKKNQGLETTKLYIHIATL